MIADDSGLLRQLLAQVLISRGFVVAGLAGTPTELLNLVAAEPPNVVLLDIRMPPGYRDEGIRAAEAIKADRPDVGLLVLSHYAETSYAMRLLEASNRAVGYLVKDRVQDTDRLVEAINRVAAGEIVIDPDAVQRMLMRRRTVDPLECLTDGERDVLVLMAEGLSNSAIARKLCCRPKTVEKRATALSQKLRLPQADAPERADVNLRVLAVLTFLRSAGAGVE
ncbi:response regulator transcription factor [Streptomyces sp. NPDC000151]|uniref:response regulator transcription factor n=1 Tax=Streptomyces sp. NPDC000151 TaxID=3154244 RepID=UPI0033178249